MRKELSEETKRILFEIAMYNDKTKPEDYLFGQAEHMSFMTGHENAFIEIKMRSKAFLPNTGYIRTYEVNNTIYPIVREVATQGILYTAEMTEEEFLEEKRHYREPAGQKHKLKQYLEYLANQKINELKDVLLIQFDKQLCWNKETLIKVMVTKDYIDESEGTVYTLKYTDTLSRKDLTKTITNGEETIELFTLL